MAQRSSDRDYLAHIVLTKTAATNAGIRVVEQATSIVGAPAIFRKNPMQRYYRDVRPSPFHPMTNDAAKELVGKTALGIRMEFTPHWDASGVYPPVLKQGLRQPHPCDRRGVQIAQMNSRELGGSSPGLLRIRR